jgi:serralysin
MTTKPVFTLDQIISQIESGYFWNRPTITDATTGIVIHPTITYSMTGINRDNPVEPGDGQANEAAQSIVPPMSQDTQDKVNTAFQLWDDLIAPNLQLTNDPNADVTFNFTCAALPNPVTVKGTIGDTITGVEIWFPNSASADGQPTLDYQDPTYGSHVFSSYLHEIGHSLGLNHPGPYNAGDGDIEYDNNPPLGAVYAQDTIQFSVMSYFKETHYAAGGANYTVNGQQIEPQTPMLDDVATVQAMYGADLTTRLGDTVYGFNSSFGTTGPGSVYNFNVNTHPVMCIYDAGGNDTLDCAGFSQDQIIDLAPGHFSSIGGMQNNVSMAFNQGPGFNPYAVIENAVGGSGNDTIYGNDANNILDGGLGVNSLYGGNGDDWLIATYQYNPFAFDIMDGGADTDTVDFGRYQDAVRIDLGAQSAWTTDGADLSSGTLRKVASLISIENAVGGAGNDEIRGDNGDNVLYGGAGDDTFYAGIGNDTVHGGQGSDTLSFAEVQPGVTVDLAAGKATYADSYTLYDSSGNADGGSAGLYTVTWDSIENVIGTTGNDVLTGDTGNNTLNGGLGNDTLIAGSGVDSLYGDAGDDTLVEVYKDNPYAFDYLDGGADTDTVDFSSFQDAVRVDLGAKAAWTTDGADLGSGTLRKVASLISIENVIGGAGNDEIRGDIGNNTLDGGAGDDTIYAGVGNDTVHGGQGTNTLSFADITTGVTVDLASGKATYLDSGPTYDDAGNVNGFVTGLNTVTWDGIENLTGGSGDDVLTGDSNNNTLDGGDGTDTAVFHGARSDYTITPLSDGSIQVADSVAGRDGTDLLKNIEKLQFSDGESTVADIEAHLVKLQSIDGMNVAFAYPGATASGLHFALAGTDVTAAYGNDGNDVLDASGTSNYQTMLFGGAGDDTLIAGSGGSYTLQGGEGDDTAVFAGKQSDYTVADGTPVGWPGWATVTDNTTGAINWLQGIEHLQFADGTIPTPGLKSINQIGTAGDDVLTAGDDGESLDGGAGNDRLVGGAGDDILVGGPGADQLIGGAGNDVLLVDSSDTLIDGGPGDDSVYVDNSQGPAGVHLNLANANVEFVYGGLGNDVLDASGMTSATQDFGSYQLSGIEMWGQWGDDTLIGGNGDDTLFGDEWLVGGGNDWLDGGPGNDWLAGGNGDDTFVFRPGSGQDTVYDFDQTWQFSYENPSIDAMVHTNDHDVIRIEGGLFTDFNALVASGAMTQVGGNVVIKLTDVDQVTLRNINVSDLGAKDFVFVGATVNSGTQNVQSGSVVSGSTVNSGLQIVTSGGSADGTTIGSAGVGYVFSGGTVKDATVSGIEIVYGAASGSVVANGGYDYVGGAGASASGTVLMSGGDEYVGNGGTTTGTQVESGGVAVAELGGTASGTTVNAGGFEIVQSGGVTSGTHANGVEYVLAGGSASDATVGSGGVEVVYGAASNLAVGSGSYDLVGAGGNASGTQVNGGSEYVLAGGGVSDTTVSSGLEVIFGSASGTVLDNGASEFVEAGATASGTVLNSGSTEYVLPGGSETGSEINGGTQVVYGTATSATVTAGMQDVEAGASTSATRLGGGFEYVLSDGVASDTTVAGGYEYVFAGGSANGATLSAGTLEIAAGGSTGGSTISFAGGGTLILDDARQFDGLVAGFGGPNARFDLADIAFGSGTARSFVEDASAKSGILSVTDGTNTASLTLLGQYMAGSFNLASDGHGGTLITDPSTLDANSNLLAASQHA